MKNIDKAEELVHAYANVTKKELVKIVSEHLNVSVANARVYIYNVQKRIDKRAAGLVAKNKTVKAAAELGVSA